MKIITRDSYLSELISLKGTPDIKIITGIRRAGKSLLLNDFIKYIENNDSKANIIYVNFYDLKFDELKEYHALNDYIETSYRKSKNNYVFIDEVQLCPNFEVVINSLHSSMKYDIYITGSNAFLLSSDLATLFTGRYMSLHVLPFGFKEYSLYNKKEKDVDVLFDNYVKEGGISGSYIYSDDKQKDDYINNISETIIKRDIKDKYNITDTDLMEKLTTYLMSNIGNLTSPNNISNTLTSNRIVTNHNTINSYLNYISRSYMFYEVKRYDIQGKNYLKTNSKYYLADHSIRRAKLGNKNLDIGRIYENIVAIELIRRGYRIYVGKLYKKEIDFVAMKGSEQIYIQVSDDISNEDTFKREYSPLLSINDAYPKMIIARTKHEEYTYEGIRIVDIARWLMNE